MLLPLCLLLPLTQGVPQEPANPPIFSVTYHGAETFLVDHKDQQLLHALEMIDDRLLELPAELDELQLPPPMIGLATRLLGGPMSVAVGIDSEPIPGMDLPFIGELRATRGPAEAQALADDLLDFLEMMGMPLDTPPEGELWEVPAPVPLWLGAEERDFRICLGSPDGLAVEELRRLLPANARPSFTGQVDYGRFLDLLQEALPEGEGGELEQIQSLFDGMGLGDLRYEWAMGSDSERQFVMVNLPGWGQGARELGLLPKIELTPDVIACIPRDATWAVASVFDFGAVMESYRELLEGLGGPESFDLYEVIQAETGLNVEEELIAPIGTSLCIYASDSTGGGGVFSIAVVLGLADRDRFLATWSKLEQVVNDLGAGEARGYVRMSRWEQDGTEFTSLFFPGLPVPFELTMTTTENHAIFGASPQAAMGALEQLRNPRTNLLDNQGFQEQLPVDMEGCVNIQWLDTQRLMRDGYGTLGLMCSSLANAVRSPMDPSREPGAILPSFPRLYEGAKGIVGVARVAGEDYLLEYRMDRSQLVNAAGVTGFLHNSPLLLLFGLGAVTGVVAQEATESLVMAEEAVVSLDTLRIHEALDNYAINNGGRYPEDLQELVLPDENGYSYLESPTALTDPWGDPYEYEPPSAANPRPQVFSRHYGK